MSKLALPQLTLCCVDTTGRIPSSLQALQHCLNQIDFGDTILLTLPELLTDMQIPGGLRIVQVEPLKSIEAYSEFMVRSLNCQRRLNIDPPCRSNIDPGRVAEF